MGNGEQRRSESDVQRDRAAVRDILPATVALLLLQGSLVALDPDGRANAARLAWSLSPILPALWLVRAQLRILRRADDYQRTLHLEAMAFAFGVALAVSFVGGLLDAARVGSARQSLQIGFIAGLLSWLSALAWKLKPER
jgi:hypothetical protein